MISKKRGVFVVVLFWMTVLVFLCPDSARADADKEGFVWMNDLKKARAKARVEKKPLFVMFRCEP